jgi:hypothetical protein
MSQYLERTSKNPPAYGTWNVKKGVVATGEALLGPHPVGNEEFVCL